LAVVSMLVYASVTYANLPFAFRNPYSPRHYWFPIKHRWSVGCKYSDF